MSDFNELKEIPENIKEHLKALNHRKILKLYEYRDCYFVIFGWGTNDRGAINNLWKLSRELKVLWKIEAHAEACSMDWPPPYTSLRVKDDQLLAYSFDGVDLKVDFDTGFIETIPGQRPW